jgi:hypothetical protein
MVNRSAIFVAAENSCFGLSQAGSPPNGNLFFVTSVWTRMKRATNHTFLRTIRRALEESRSALSEGLPADISGEATIKRLRRIAHAKKVTQALAQDAGPLADCLHKVRIILNQSDTPGRIIAALWPVLDAAELKQAPRIAPKNRMAA